MALLKANQSLLSLAEKLWQHSKDEQSAFVAAVLTNKDHQKALVNISLKNSENNYQNSFAYSFKNSNLFDPRILLPSEKINFAGDINHTAGQYYVMDQSSALVCSIAAQIIPTAKNILDLCASPGGKSIFFWNKFKPNLLVSNEVTNSRISSLISNLKRCKVSPCYLSVMKPEEFHEKVKNYFDLILVDAPCSGQSMVSAKKQYMSSFHSSMVNKNAMRQRKILSQIIPCLTPNGYLVYSTCTFSLEENEKIVDWVLKNFPELECIKSDEKYNFLISSFSPSPTYKIYPQYNLGAGGFVTIFKKITTLEKHSEEIESPNILLSKLRIAWKQELVA